MSEAGMVMPFVTVVSKGGPHEDESYVAGWEMGSLDATLSQRTPQAFTITLHTENLPQADLIAMRYGYILTAFPSKDAEGWSICLLDPKRETQ
jgi:hypothetical protein